MEKTFTIYAMEYLYNQKNHTKLITRSLANMAHKTGVTILIFFGI